MVVARGLRLQLTSLLCLAAQIFAFLSPSTITVFTPSTFSTVPDSKITRIYSGGSGFGSDTPKKQSVLQGRQALQKQMKSFVNLTKEQSGNCVIKDVYTRGSGGAKFYFAGKVVYVKSQASADQAVQLQKKLIADHSRAIAPDLPPFVQFFTAPGNTEIPVAKNEERLYRALAAEDGDESGRQTDVSDVDVESVGFMPEVYELGEPVFYVRKGPNGECIQPPAQVKIEGLEKMQSPPSP